jgi:hypothetical protein
LTAVLELWSLPTFERAVLALLTLPRSVLVGLAAEENLAKPDPIEPLSEPENWAPATTALRTLYGFARTDGIESVVADLHTLLAKRDNVGEYEVGLSLLPSLLVKRESFDRHQRYKRTREMTLPQVVESSVGIQLKAISPTAGSSSPVELVPLIVMRLDFDEPVLGSESITVSIPVGVLESMRIEISSMREKYEHIVESLPDDLLKPEAYLAWPQVQEQ